MKNTIKNLLSRFGPTGVLFVIGFIVIIYIAFGFVYWQQASQQRGLNEEIANLSLILSRPPPSAEELQKEYEKTNSYLSLAPKTNVDAIEKIVGIAGKSGIDVDEASDKLIIPPASISKVRIGGGSYQLISFNNIIVQGDYDDVMAFISDLDSGETLNTTVLKRVDTSQIEVAFTGEEGARRAEFRSVTSAVVKMMSDNGLLAIPHPISFAGGVATNLTGDDPNTKETVEGFPDIITTAADRGYSGDATPRAGYVLYNHDKISTDNTTFETVSYLTVLTTTYYYTCEVDGTVRQFDGADVVTATEYPGSEEFKVEIAATLDVDIYSKP